MFNISNLHQTDKMKVKITPEGGVGFLVNLEPPGAHGTVQKNLVSLEIHDDQHLDKQKMILANK